MAVQPSICFVVQCFNEEDNVAPTMESIRAAAGPDLPFSKIASDLDSHRLAESAHDGEQYLQS
jgi:hypothetical protein